MKKFILFMLLAALALLVIGSAVSAQAETKGIPPGPEMVEEINGTRGAALLTYHPQYAVVPVPVTGEQAYFRHHNSPSQKMVEMIARTRGAAMQLFWENSR